MTALLALRIFGPCSTAELSRRVGCDRYSVMTAAESLCDQGLATRSPGGLWDVSEAGRAMIDPVLRRQRRVAAQARRWWPYEHGGRAS